MTRPRPDGFYWARQVRWRPNAPPQAAEYADGIWSFAGDFTVYGDGDVIVYGEQIQPPAYEGVEA
nr:hypothetical protein [uncultured Rhodopila sp.]